VVGTSLLEREYRLDEGDNAQDYCYFFTEYELH